MGRTQIVWLSLLASLTSVGGLLLATEGRTAVGADSMPLVELSSTTPTTGLEQLFQTRQPVNPDRWSGIVIHHSRSPLGSAQTIALDHEQRGYAGLGYHFVIANGQGARDGEIQVGYRWTDQLAGVHVAGPSAELYNRETIGICLIGDGDRRPFTRRQLASLVRLVATLQHGLGLDDSAVLLGREISGTSEPGRLFPEAAFRDHLAGLR